MFFKREVLLTWDLDEYQRTKSLLADHQIEYTTRSNPVTNPGRYHGVPSINASAAYEYHVYVAGKDHDSPMESSIYMRLDLDDAAMDSGRAASADKDQPQVLSVNGKDYCILKLLGRGKGGYSYLAERDGKKVVLKQIHHEPCDYYQFGNKIEAELRDYDRLKRIGIPLPKMLDIDKDNERIIKEYIDGDTVYQMVLEDRLPETCLEQVKAMCGPLYAANTNIDYFPTNFILQDGTLYYVDYECNEYMEEWNFENWGVKYWSKTQIDRNK